MAYNVSTEKYCMPAITPQVVCSGYQIKTLESLYGPSCPSKIVYWKFCCVLEGYRLQDRNGWILRVFLHRKPPCTKTFYAV